MWPTPNLLWLVWIGALAVIGTALVQGLCPRDNTRPDDDDEEDGGPWWAGR